MAHAPLVVRLPDDLRQRVELFQEESRLSSFSVAARMLIELGLDRASQLDPKWRALVVDESFKRARGEMLKAVQTAIDQVGRR